MNDLRMVDLPAPLGPDRMIGRAAIVEADLLSARM